jgi:DNA-binding SARP family transcriptional activator
MHVVPITMLRMNSETRNDRHVKQQLLVIRTFGPLNIDIFGQTATLPRHAAALLAYLGTRLHKQVPREQLASVLWDAQTTKQARHSLSQLLYMLKPVLPEGVLGTDGRHVVLSSEHVESDYAWFRSSVVAGRHADALEAYAGPFLEGFAFLTDEYDDWRVATAAAAEADAVSCCVALITEALEEEDHVRAAELARRGLLIAPASEYFTRIRIEALASSGDVSAALRELEAAKKRSLLGTGNIPASLTHTLAIRIARLPSIADQRISAGLSTKLVGRQAEIRRLRAQWDLSKEGCRVAVVRGEPGIGKSRLLQHTVRWAVLDGARSFMYSCSEVESRLPGSAVAGLLRDGFREEDLKQLEPRWRNALGSIAPEVIAGSDEVDDSPRIRWEAIARYFALASVKTPVVIAVDDYQWIDDESREILVYLRKRLPESPVFVIVSGRGSIRPPTYEDDLAHASIIELGELNREDAYLLFDDFEARHQIRIDEATRQVLVSTIGGRPFFLVEALRHIRDCGANVTPATMVGDLLSPNIEDFLRRRLVGLDASARAIAEALAVLNREAPLHLLARAAGISIIRAAEGVDELVRRGIVAEGSSIQFGHAFFRESAHGFLPLSQRRLWHLRIASALKDLDGGRHSEIAFHLEQGEDYEAAFDYADRACQASLQQRAYEEAEQQCARMLRCAPPSKVQYARASHLKFLARFNRFADVRHYFPELEQYFSDNNDDEGIVICAVARYWLAEQQGDTSPVESIKEAKRVLQMAERYTPKQVTSVLWQVADAMRRSGEYALLGHFARLLETMSLEAVHDATTATEMLTTAALVGGLANGYSKGVALADQAVTKATGLADDALLTRALYARGTARIWSGDLIGGRSDYDEILSRVDAFAPDDLVSRVKSNYAVLLMDQGEYALAEDYAQATLREAGMVRRTYAFGNLALIHLHKGDYAAAKHYACALLAAHNATPQAWIPMHAEALLGLIDLAVGDVHSAKLRAANVAAHNQSADGVVDSSHIYTLRARVLELGGDWVSAAATLQAGARAIGEKEAITASRLEAELARVLAAAGEFASAKHLARRVAAKCESGGAWAVVELARGVLQSIPSVVDLSSGTPPPDDGFQGVQIPRMN